MRYELNGIKFYDDESFTLINFSKDTFFYIYTQSKNTLALSTFYYNSLINRSKNSTSIFKF